MTDPTRLRGVVAVSVPAVVTGRLTVRNGLDSDMLKATYDPRDIAGDVFDLGNHTGTLDTATVTIDGGLL